MVVPLDARQWSFAVETTKTANLDIVLEVSYEVKDIDSTVRSAEQDGATIRRPLDDLESDV